MPPTKHWILIIEDEKELCEMLSEELANEGFSVLSSANAMEAIRRLKNQQFECILLDMHLEGGTGNQVIQAVREDRENMNQTTPILVVSGQLTFDLVSKIKDSVSAVVVKPFDLSALILKVRSLCSLSTDI